MKKTIMGVLAFLCMLLFCSATFAKADVPKSVLNKVLGTWKVDETCLDNFIEEILAKGGMYRSNPQYANYKAYLKQTMESDKGGSSWMNVQITLGNDKMQVQVVNWDGNTSADADYKIDKDGVLYATGDGGTIPVGSFTPSYTKFYLMGGDTFYLVKM